MDTNRKYLTDNKTIGQIGGRLLGDFLERESRKFMQRYADKVRVTDMHEPEFVEGFITARTQSIVKELGELWPHMTDDQRLTLLERINHVSAEW